MKDPQSGTTITLPKVGQPGQTFTIRCNTDDAIIVDENVLDSRESATFIAKPVLSETSDEVIGIRWEKGTR